MKLRTRIAAAVGVAVAALGAAGVAAASGTPQSPQAITLVVTCPGFAPFTATGPTVPSSAVVGTENAILPRGILNVPADKVVLCSLTDPAGNVFPDIPFLIAPLK